MNDNETKKFIFLTWALHQFIQEFSYSLTNEPKIKVKQLYNRFSKKMPGGKDFNISNQVTSILFLWGSVALPKETFFENIPPIIFQDLSNIWGKWTIKTWELSHNETSKDLKSFVRHMRNSINHGRFSTDNDLNYTFEDKRNDKINFCVNADYDSIIQFSKSLCDGFMINKWSK
ncbi:MAG: HEPN family nuclease [Thermodesulfobacteriota bacterium]